MFRGIVLSLAAVTMILSACGKQDSQSSRVRKAGWDTSTITASVNTCVAGGNPPGVVVSNLQNHCSCLIDSKVSFTWDRTYFLNIPGLPAGAERNNAVSSLNSFKAQCAN